MEILNVNDKGKLEILPYILKIKEFHSIYVSDLTTNKLRSITQFTFIWFYADFASPYVKQGLSDEVKWDLIREDIGWSERVLNKNQIKEAIKKYRELNSTETLRLLEAGQNAINSVIDYFNNLDLSEKNDKGLLINNISQVMTSLKGIGSVNKDIKKLKTEVLAEMTKIGRIKGGEELAMFEDPE